MTANVAEGPIYTRGRSYRARAEARQRAYRAHNLDAPHGEFGHLLSKEAASLGGNFVLDEAHRAARARADAGKGVTQRTFANMLSSQAMCFNLFAPLASRLDFARDVLEPFIPGLEKITAVRIEHTPARDIFNDQTGLGGVDCDLLIEGRAAKGTFVQVVETKFVEREFSVCGFRKSGRAKKGQVVCPVDVPVGENRDACLYVRKKRYSYWERTDLHALLRPGAIPPAGCPFGGQHWQLWVNLALAYEEAARRDATNARFAVCSSSRNTALLGDGRVLDEFRSLLRDPESVSHLDLEEVLMRVDRCAPPELSTWAEGLSSRYAAI